MGIDRETGEILIEKYKASVAAPLTKNQKSTSRNRGETMSIIDKDKIDSIGINKDNGKVILEISDHLDWSCEYEHLVMLQDKINSYLSFIESGDQL